jgi:hypothetical protein
MRERVERLFKMMIDSEAFPQGEEATVYTVFLPQEGEPDEESIEVSELELDTSDRDSVKRFLERTTREALEADVKGLRLYAYVYEAGQELHIVRDSEEDHTDLIKAHIERMREEA